MSVAPPRFKLYLSLELVCADSKGFFLQLVFKTEREGWRGMSDGDEHLFL